MGAGGRADRGTIGVAAGLCLAAALALTPARASAPDQPSRLDGAPARLAAIPDQLDLAPPGPFRLAPAPAPGDFSDKWREVSAAIAADRATLAACRAEPAGCPEPARRFLAVLAQAQGEVGRARLGILNRAVNLAVAYTSDMAQHGRDDVWSAPLATFASGMGDCEDYAIAKYVALLEAGVAPEDVRVVIVHERRSGLHAVASVRLGGAWLVLDNRRMALVEDYDLAGYRAVAVLDAPRAAPAPVLAETTGPAADPTGRQGPSASPDPAS